MELSDYLRIIRRRGWLIILLAILTAGAAFGFSKMQTPIYKSTAQMLITSRPDFGQTQAARELRRDFARYLLSSLRAKEVIDILQLDMDPRALLGNVAIAPASDANIITIEVKNPDGELANQIATKWGDLLIQYRTAENASLPNADRIKAQHLDDPRYGLDSPKTKINTAAGAIFGLLLGLVLIFLLEWLESGGLRRPEDVERFIDVPVIGKIPT
ncbi:MAG TPA: hypothetical protein ENJ56_04420 [Anaerolineae bacterium]|nr:hypothetical protein [Anaerolineae bacterium]